MKTPQLPARAALMDKRRLWPNQASRPQPCRPHIRGGGLVRPSCCLVGVGQPDLGVIVIGGQLRGLLEGGNRGVILAQIHL